MRVPEHSSFEIAEIHSAPPYVNGDRRRHDQHYGQLQNRAPSYLYIQHTQAISPNEGSAIRTMFTITTRPPGSSPYASASSTPSTHRKHAAEEEAMDVDFEEFQRDLGEGSSTGDKSIVSPGEPISSAKEFMRSVNDST